MVKQQVLSIFNVLIWNHPIETTIYKQMFQVPGKTNMSLLCWWFQSTSLPGSWSHIPDPCRHFWRWWYEFPFSRDGICEFSELMSSVFAAFSYIKCWHPSTHLPNLFDPISKKSPCNEYTSLLFPWFVSLGALGRYSTWRIIPFREWLITMVSKSPK